MRVSFQRSQLVTVDLDFPDGKLPSSMILNNWANADYVGLGKGLDILLSTRLHQEKVIKNDVADWTVIEE